MTLLYQVINDTETLRCLFETASNYLKDKTNEDQTKAESIFKDNITLWKTNKKNIRTRKDVFKRLVESSVNSYSKPTVFGGPKEGREGRLERFLKEVTEDFNSELISNADVENLQDRIRERRKKIVGVAIKVEKDTMVNGLAKSLIESAQHIQEFKFSSEDSNFADSYRKHFSAMEGNIANPYVALNNVREFCGLKIHGIGFALSCDFLKEIGLSEYGKPDTHIMDLLPFFTGSIYKNHNKNQEAFGQCLIDIIRVSNALEVEPYELDKLLYLIGSGKLIDNKLQYTPPKRKKELSQKLVCVLKKNNYDIPEFINS